MEEVHFIPTEYTALRNTDLRNKIWYVGANNMNDLDIFFVNFSNLHKDRVISNNHNRGPRFSNLREPDYSRLVNLLNRGRDLYYPSQIYRVIIICDDSHGVMIFTAFMPALMGDPAGEYVMSREFFVLKAR